MVIVVVVVTVVVGVVLSGILAAEIVVVALIVVGVGFVALRGFWGLGIGVLVVVALGLGLSDDQPGQEPEVGLGDPGRGVGVEGVQRGDPEAVGAGEVGVDVGDQAGGFFLAVLLRFLALALADIALVVGPPAHPRRVVVVVGSVAAAGVLVGAGVAAGGEVVAADLLGAVLVDRVFPALEPVLGDQIARRGGVGLVEVLVAVGVAFGHRAETGVVVVDRQLVGMRQFPVGLHGVLDAAHGAGVREDHRLDRGADVVLRQVPAILELVDAGRAQQEPAEVGADIVDRRIEFAGGGAGLTARLVGGDLVGLKHPKITHCLCLLPVDGVLHL